MTRKTQKKLRKLLTLVSCAVLLVCVTIVGTIAYLSDTTNTVKNTFTVGNVGFDTDAALDEAKVNEYGVKVDASGKTKDEIAEGETWTAAARVTANTYKLVPSATYTKDPTVHMSATTEDAWLFVKVDNGITAIEAAGDTTIAKQMENLGWTLVNATQYPGVYAYKETVGANEDIVVFNSFTLSGTAEVANYTSANITIQAYAIQAEGFDNAAAAYAAAPCTWGANTAA